MAAMNVTGSGESTFPVKWLAPGTSDAKTGDSAVNGNKAAKDDQKKWRMSLLSAVAIREIGRVAVFGVSKYAEHNWRRGFKWSRLSDACIRHVLSWMAGETIDPESGLPHLAHAAWNLMALLEFQFTKVGVDDRFAIPQYLSVD